MMGWLLRKPKNDICAHTQTHTHKSIGHGIKTGVDPFQFQPSLFTNVIFIPNSKTQGCDAPPKQTPYNSLGNGGKKDET